MLISSCAQKKEILLFSSSRNGNSDIFIMDFKGENLKPLAQTEFEEWGSTWINENEISFLRQKEDSIYRIKLNIESKEETELPHPFNCILDDKNVLYSPSSQLQLYSCNNDIFLYDPTSKELKNITKNMNGNALYPSWSNDGNSIIFTSNHLGSNDLFIYEIQSTKVAQLTDSDSNNERGELSPNRKLLAYSSDHFEKGNQEIVLKDLKSGLIKNVSMSTGTELIARFSNDGNLLFYGTNNDGNWEIYSYNLRTDVKKRLTNVGEFDGDPRILKNK